MSVVTNCLFNQGLNPFTAVLLYLGSELALHGKNCFINPFSCFISKQCSTLTVCKLHGKLHLTRLAIDKLGWQDINHNVKIVIQVMLANTNP